jgi:hypothetical protein
MIFGRKEKIIPFRIFLLKTCKESLEGETLKLTLKLSQKRILTYIARKPLFSVFKI